MVPLILFEAIPEGDGYEYSYPISLGWLVKVFMGGRVLDIL